MKLKCKLCAHEVTIGENVLSGSALMIRHVQERHQKVGLNAMMALGGYASTYFFEPVVCSVPTAPDRDSIGDHGPDAHPDVAAYKETRKALLQGFREWAKGNIK